MTPPSAFGTFRVLHQIGSGVLGPVFRAYDSDRECLAAVKAFTVDLLPEEAAQLAAGLQRLVRPVADPSIVGVVEAGLAGNVPFLALEYATGDALDVVLRNAGQPSVAEAIELCRAVGKTIDASWAQGIGHGSLHPRDVFVTAGGDEMRVSGFGVAQALEAVGLRAPVRRPYAAPERLAGAEWDIKADVYALAAIAREVLTEEGSTEPPRRFSATLDRALSESPDARFATASELVAALEIAATVRHPVSVTTPTMVRTVPSTAAPAPASRREVDEGLRALEAPGLRAAGIELDLPRLVATPGLLASVSAERQAFPWAAAIALALAGVSVGAVAGYKMGFTRGSDRATALEIAEAARVAEEARLAAARKVVPSSDSPSAGVEAPPAPSARQAREVPPRTLSAQARAGTGLATEATTGSIDFDTLPRGARVTVDGRFKGETPVRVIGLSPGEHRVRFELAGHRPHASLVSVQGGATTPHKIRLEESTPESEKRTGKNR